MLYPIFMQIKFTPYDYDLESIESFLKNYSLPKREKIRKFLRQLELIDRSLSEEQPFNRDFVEAQRSKVKSLKGRCHHMEMQQSIIELAEEAEEVANASATTPGDILSKKIKKLRKRLDKIANNYRPTKTNAKFIQFARACLLKAEKHEPVLLKTKGGGTRKIISLERNLKETTLEDLDLAERLYEIARALYKNNDEEFLTSLRACSFEEMQEIIYHVSLMEGDLKKWKTKGDRLKIIQGLIGFAHILADYYLGESPYPSKQEIKALFTDLDFIETDT